VELRGFEPLTFSLRTRRATNCAIAPGFTQYHRVISRESPVRATSAKRRTDIERARSLGVDVNRGLGKAGVRGDAGLICTSRLFADA